MTAERFTLKLVSYLSSESLQGNGKEGEKGHGLYNLTILQVGGSAGLLASAVPLLPRQLFIQHGARSHPILPSSTCQLLVESGHLELAAVVSRPVAEDRFVTVQWLVLLDQPDVAWRPVPLGVLEPTLSEREDCVIADVIAFYVDHQKMVLLPELGVLLARRMGVCEDQGIELSWIEAIPQNAARPIRNLCGHQHFAPPPPLQ